MPKFGTFKDIRDGKVYRTVLMPDGKWWSAENLAWEGVGVFYNNDPANGPIYGRLYDWAGAVSSIPANCHMPTVSEWDSLAANFSQPFGEVLRSAIFGGSNLYGFSVVGAGDYDPRYGGAFNNKDNSSLIWTDGPESGGSYPGEYFIASFDDRYSSQSYHIYYHSVRFIVDSGNIPDPEPADGITFSPRTIETPFKAQSGNLRRNFVQGAPVFEADLKFEVDNSEIEAMDAWIDSIGMGTFSRSAFAIGNADTVFQVLEPPTRSFSHKGMTVSMSVTATQDVPAPLPAVIGTSVPVVCPFPLSGQGSLGNEVQQLTEATGGRSTAKAFMAPRGERMTFTYATDKDGLAQFISWWSAYTKCGHRGFFASMPGRTAWYFEFVEQPKFTLKSDLGTVSLDIVGRSSSREIVVTGGVTWISNGDTMTISIVSRFVLVDSKNVIVDPMLYSKKNVSSKFTTINFLAVPVGEYRWIVAFNDGQVSKWNDITVGDSDFADTWTDSRYGDIVQDTLDAEDILQDWEA